MTLELRPYQKIGGAWLQSMRSGILADSPGVGKTITSLMAITDGAPVIVICPASMKGIWFLETRKWRPDLCPDIISGRGNFRWPNPGELLIFNYDILPEPVPKGFPAGLIVIVDEAHAVKSNKTKRHKSVKQIVKAAIFGTGHAWGLTGTPIQNDPYEGWNLLSAFGLENIAFGHFGKFLYMFNGRQGQFGIVYGAARPEVRDCLKKVMLRRTKSEVLPELPGLTIKDVPVSIPDDVRKVCDEAMAVLLANGIDLNGALDRVEATQLSGAEFEEVSRARMALAVAKIPALLEAVESFEDAGEPLVVFSAHRAPVDVLGQRKGWGRISGSDSSERRAEVVQQFQAGLLKGVACTIQAGGTGLTLTRSSNSIFVDQAWTPAINLQARDRIHRIGQTRGVVITRLIAAHAIDERVTAVLDRKTDLVDSVIDSGAVSVSADAFEDMV
jgi:SNF2 family DNA or RNA helicase